MTIKRSGRNLKIYANHSNDLLLNLLKFRIIEVFKSVSFSFDHLVFFIFMPYQPNPLDENVKVRTDTSRAARAHQ